MSYKEEYWKEKEFIAQLKSFERKGEYILCQKEISSTALIKNNTSQTTSVVDDPTLLSDHNVVEK